MLEVGQKLWWVPLSPAFGSPHEVTVQKIGRKWASSGSGRINMTTMLVYGIGDVALAKCYNSKDEYEQEQELRKTWLKFRAKLETNYLPPVGISIADIEQAGKILKLS